MSNLSTSGVTWYMIGGLGASEIDQKFYEKEILPVLHILKNQSMHSYKLSQIYNFIESTSHPPCFFNHEEKLAKKDASLSFNPIRKTRILNIFHKHLKRNCCILLTNLKYSHMIPGSSFDVCRSTGIRTKIARSLRSQR